MIEIRYEFFNSGIARNGMKFEEWCDFYFCTKEQLYAQMMGWA